MTRNSSARGGDRLLFIVDILGTILFGIEGATAGVAGRLDAFGVMVLSFTTALGGGIVRDLLLGAAPPAALRDWRYPVAAFAGGGLVLFLRSFVEGIPPNVITVLDAAGLGLFAVAGARKALDYGMHPFMAILLGGITGVGGGTIRDVFLARVPAVLRVEIYATAALFGAAAMVACLKARLSPTVAALVGGIACFALRMVSVWRHWNLTL
jgi:uncharacterized membrane protein YeiH